MKHLTCLLATLLAATLGLTTQDADLPVVRVADGERADMQPQVSDLGFLSGTWSGSDGTSDWEAVYSTPAGGQLVAASKEIKGGRVVMIDFEHFYERDGELRLTPFPFGNRSVEFTLTEFDLGRRMAVFENPEHDFPKRFEYQRTDDSHLRIELTGEMGGQSTTLTLEFERAGD